MSCEATQTQDSFFPEKSGHLFALGLGVGAVAGLVRRHLVHRQRFRPLLVEPDQLAQVQGRQRLLRQRKPAFGRPLLCPG